MKLKTLHQFLLKLLISFFILGQASLVWPSSIPNKGLIQSFEIILKQKNNQLSQKEKKDKKQLISESAKVELTKPQLEEILFFTPNNYLQLFLNNNCSLYTFLSHKVLYLRNTPLNYVDVSLREIKKKEKTVAIPSELFIQTYYKNHCKLSYKQKEFFETGRLKKTLSKITPKLPTTKTECRTQWKSWQQNINTEHICAITQKIELANKAEVYLNKTPSLSLSERSGINRLRKERNDYLKEFTELQRSYFSNLCNNYDSRAKFCSSYSDQDYWTKISNFEVPKYKVAWKCKQFLKKKSLTKSDINKCIRKFRSDNLSCSRIGARQKSVLYPMPECKEISDALNISRLKNDYHDCPSIINNTGIVNVFRVLAHFGKGKATQAPKDCVFPSFASIYNIYQKNKEEKKWPLQICYKDSISKKDRCYPFVPGNHKSESYAQNNVVSNILFQSKLESQRPSCLVANHGLYNPKRLTYKTGCWIIPESKKCQSYNCPQTVILNGQKVIKLFTKGDLSFNYFKNKYNSKIQSLDKKIIEEYQLKLRPISSLTSARFFLESKPKGIIHGMGCAEDLHPSNFQIKSLGQCTPLPFIVDGYKSNNDKALFSFRSAIDDVHSPRLIQWARVFSAVSRYAEQHPLKTWNLNGLY